MLHIASNSRSNSRSRDKILPCFQLWDLGQTQKLPLSPVSVSYWTCHVKEVLLIMQACYTSRMSVLKRCPPPPSSPGCTQAEEGWQQDIQDARWAEGSRLPREWAEDSNRMSRGMKSKETTKLRTWGCGRSREIMGKCQSEMGCLCNQPKGKGRMVKGSREILGKGHEENGGETDEQGSQEMTPLKGKKLPGDKVIRTEKNLQVGVTCVWHGSELHIYMIIGEYSSSHIRNVIGCLCSHYHWPQICEDISYTWSRPWWLYSPSHLQDPAQCLECVHAQLIFLE